jgi:hypothetical protein
MRGAPGNRDEQPAIARRTGPGSGSGARERPPAPGRLWRRRPGRDTRSTGLFAVGHGPAGSSGVRRAPAPGVHPAAVAPAAPESAKSVRCPA